MGNAMVFGSPGCGKTQFCSDLSNRLINVEKRCSKEEVAYVAFGKKAAMEAADRCGIKAEDRRELWYRTLHSACYKLLGMSHGSVVSAAKLREFSKKIGVQVDSELAVEGDEFADLAEVLLAVQRNRSVENGDQQPSKVIGLYQLSRLLCRTASQLEACRKEPHPKALAMAAGMLDLSQYRALITHYELWKKADGLADFTDMLERVVVGDVALPAWKYAFGDEAQDLAPLQWAVMGKLFEGRVNDLFLAGDDDQAIMGFQGASATDFLAYRGRGRKIHLQQTHRFGAEVVHLAREIALRLSEREDKDVIPADVESVVGTLYEFNPKLHPGRKFLLHRHIAGCRAIAQSLISRGVPFWNERGLNPLARKTEIRGFEAFSKLARGEQLTAFDVTSLLDVTPAIRRMEGSSVRMVKHGSKKKLSEEAPRTPYTLLDLEGKHITKEFAKAIRERRYDVSHIEFPEYYRQLEESGWDLSGDDQPDAIITTIHGSKGRERDLVFLWDEVTHKCMRDENEHRVAYVGATRPKKALFIVREKVITNWSTTQYPYPVTDSVIDEV